MKRFSILGLVSLAVVSLLYLLWIGSTRFVETAQLKNLIAEVSVSQDQLSKDQNKVDVNLYLDPELLQLWSSEKSQEDVSVDPWTTHLITRAFAGPIRWPDMASGKRAITSDPQFSAIKTKLLASLDKPLFVPVENGTTQPDPQKLTLLARALLQEAAYFQSNRNFDQALQNYRMVLKLATRLGRNKRLKNQNWKYQLQRDLCWALSQSFPKPDSLASAQWKMLSDLLAEQAPNLKDYSSCLAFEISLLLDGDLELQESQKKLGKWLSIPGLELREKNILLRHLAQAITSWEKGELPKTPSYPRQPGFRELLSSESGIFTQTLLPDYRALAVKIKQSRAQLIGLQLAFAIRAYQTEKGQVPANLADLRHLELNLPPKDEQQELGVIYYDDGSQVILSLQLPEDNSVPIAIAQDSWVYVSGEQLRFNLK